MPSGFFRHSKIRILRVQFQKSTYLIWKSNIYTDCTDFEYVRTSSRCVGPPCMQSSGGPDSISSPASKITHESLIRQPAPSDGSDGALAALAIDGVVVESRGAGPRRCRSGARPGPWAMAPGPGGARRGSFSRWHSERSRQPPGSAGSESAPETTGGARLPPSAQAHTGSPPSTRPWQPCASSGPAGSRCRARF